MVYILATIHTEQNPLAILSFEKVMVNATENRSSNILNTTEDIALKIFVAIISPSFFKLVPITPLIPSSKPAIGNITIGNIKSLESWEKKSFIFPLFSFFLLLKLLNKDLMLFFLILKFSCVFILTLSYRFQKILCYFFSTSYYFVISLVRVIGFPTTTEWHPSFNNSSTCLGSHISSSAIKGVFISFKAVLINS